MLACLVELLNNWYPETQLYRSDDNGETWVLYNGGLPPWFRPWDLEEDPGHPGTVYVRGRYKYGLYRSVDYGHTFEHCENGLPDGPTIMTELTANQHNNKVYVCIDDWGVYSTADGGNSWGSLPTPPIGSIEFFHVTQENIYTRSDGFRHKVYSFSTDQWSDLVVPNEQDTVTMVNPVSFQQGDTLVVGAWKRPYDEHVDLYQFYRSVDNGESWTAFGAMFQPPPATYPYYYQGDVTSRIIMGRDVGGVPTLYASTDQGRSWNTSTDIVSEMLWADYAQTDSLIYAAANSQGVYVSTTNGMSWDNMNFSGSNAQALTICDNQIFVLSINNYERTYDIYKYDTNNWSLLATYDGDHYSIVDITGIEALNDYVVLTAWTEDDGPLLVVSEDYGETLHEIEIDIFGASQRPRTGEMQYDSYRDRLWISTGVGLCYAELDELDVDKERIHVKPVDYGIVNAYPNPFNSWTKVTYDVTETGPVTLKLYNLLGQELTTLVDDVIQQPGRYYINLRAQDYAAGTYIVEYKDRNHIKSCKIVLVK